MLTHVKCFCSWARLTEAVWILKQDDCVKVQADRGKQFDSLCSETPPDRKQTESDLREREREREKDRERGSHRMKLIGRQTTGLLLHAERKTRALGREG